ncbi:ead/Ea22-like family protein [Escherichia coli]|nr:ead/Ea22-like family protein [Escherichia coli]EHX1363500.1 ead/Ea22-like family protein [Escherichia coli]EHX9351773.1 ead/Ea22-like family protein [Escherichia coli]EJM1961057.1 ead/Ea22-like family protein [Escherichia coli]EJO4322985.1 ead/Ea22-like family protein [Escherichia coli]
MSEINYQALREAAERAIPAMERLSILPADDDLLSEQELKDYGVDIDALNAFKFLAGPETVLALLDERERNQQYIKSRDQENEEIALTVGKLRVELESAENNLIDSECHVAELEEALRDKQALLEASEKRIAELEEREILLPERSSMLHRTDFHDDYQTVMAYKVSEVIDAIRATGIRIKGE